MTEIARPTTVAPSAPSASASERAEEAGERRDELLAVQSAAREHLTQVQEPQGGRDDGEHERQVGPQRQPPEDGPAPPPDEHDDARLLAEDRRHGQRAGQDGPPPLRGRQRGQGEAGRVRVRERGLEALEARREPGEDRADPRRATTARDEHRDADGAGDDPEPVRDQHGHHQALAASAPRVEHPREQRHPDPLEAVAGAQAEVVLRVLEVRQGSGDDVEVLPVVPDARQERSVGHVSEEHRRAGPLATAEQDSLDAAVAHGADRDERDRDERRAQAPAEHRRPRDRQRRLVVHPR